MARGKVNVAGGGGAFEEVAFTDIFTADGSFTALSDIDVNVFAVGPGGVGSYSGGGGSGYINIGTVSLVRDEVVTITINNGVTSFGAYLSALKIGRAHV